MNTIFQERSAAYMLLLLKYLLLILERIHLYEKSASNPKSTLLAYEESFQLHLDAIATQATCIFFNFSLSLKPLPFQNTPIQAPYDPSSSPSSHK
mmetsp:Transcript_12665/g.21467  ORF Transcript_12665/g.21467 Transcript_12665/m.21467 type:complete len:95 (-) Transcript_12665:70-354(-)